MRRVTSLAEMDLHRTHINSLAEVEPTLGYVKNGEEKEVRGGGGEG